MTSLFDCTASNGAFGIPNCREPKRLGVILRDRTTETLLLQKGTRFYNHPQYGQLGSHEAISERDNESNLFSYGKSPFRQHERNRESQEQHSSLSTSSAKAEQCTVVFLGGSKGCKLGWDVSDIEECKSEFGDGCVWV